MPKQIFVHGYLLLDDLKISKSLGNAIDPLELIDVYGADALRFWCARAVSFGHDGSASLDGIAERYERELGNDLGNLLSRTTAMIERYRDGRLAGGLATSPAIAAAIDDVHDEVPGDLDRFDLTGAIDRIWAFVRELNRYVTETGTVDDRQGPDRAGELDAGALRPRRRPARDGDRALRRTCPRRRRRSSTRSAQDDELGWDRVASRAYSTPRRPIAAAAPLFPRIEAAAGAGAA